MNDLEVSPCKPIALSAGGIGGHKLKGDAMADKDPHRKAGMKRQRLGRGIAIDDQSFSHGPKRPLCIAQSCLGLAAARRTNPAQTSSFPPVYS